MMKMTLFRYFSLVVSLTTRSSQLFCHGLNNKSNIVAENINNDTNIVKVNDEVALQIVSNEIIRIFKCSCCQTDEDHDDVVDKMKQRSSLVVASEDDSDDCALGNVNYKLEKEDEGDILIVSTSNLVVMASISTGRIEFYHQQEGKLVPLLKEAKSKFDDANAVTQDFALQYSSKEEALYGGGQYANGFMNYRSAPIYMSQFNTEAVVPFILSSQKYGILWDLYGETLMNAPQNEIHLSRHVCDDGNYLQGTFTPTASGDYWFYVVACKRDDDDTELVNSSSWFCNGNSNVTITNEGDSIPTAICEYSLANMPHTFACRVKGLVEGVKYKLKMDGTTPVVGRQLFATSIETHNKLSFKTQASDIIDYYFMGSSSSFSIEDDSITIESEEEVREESLRRRRTASSTITAAREDTRGTLDGVISNYRKLTGTAYLYEKWVYGFWQCKEHYHNQTELVEAATKFRSLQIPIDAIVQDWRYWGDLGWGPQWDTKLYPDPRGMIDTLHSSDIHFMVSVWSTFDKNTKFYRQMVDAHALINGSTYMDVWNPKAQELFYKFVREAHFHIGVDSLWLDATEPENGDQMGQSMYLGGGDEYANTYSLMVTKTVHDGLKAQYPNRRVFSLTRSSFAGQHRYGGTLWSGDTTGSWDSLRRQIAMSTNYQLSGIPYWSMDIGGFFRPDDQYKNPDYLQLLVRWFQFGVFTPIFRVHGCKSDTELWHYGQSIQNLIVDTAIRFRYRLLEYIYSGFRKVETEHYTMQRGLILDFGDNDFENVARIADQFMFGHSLMVAPIYQPDSTRTIYLPKLTPNQGKWRCLYSGNELEDGQWIKFEKLPLSRIPLFVRSSILVLGPDGRQHANDESTSNRDHLEVRVYDGANSKFQLFEDDGISSDPDRPISILAFAWDDQSRILSIEGNAASSGGAFASSTTHVISKTIDVVLVRPGVGVGVDPVEQPDATVAYNGTTVSIRLPMTMTTALLMTSQTKEV